MCQVRDLWQSRNLWFGFSLYRKRVFVFFIGCEKSPFSHQQRCRDRQIKPQTYVRFKLRFRSDRSLGQVLHGPTGVRENCYRQTLFNVLVVIPLCQDLGLYLENENQTASVIIIARILQAFFLYWSDRCYIGYINSFRTMQK